jgi:hypothetical protein
MANVREIQEGKCEDEEEGVTILPLLKTNPGPVITNETPCQIRHSLFSSVH